VETGFPKKSCSNKKLEHDVDSTQSHHALADRDIETNAERYEAIIAESATANE
jgi:hypothetical protein